MIAGDRRKAAAPSAKPAVAAPVEARKEARAEPAAADEPYSLKELILHAPIPTSLHRVTSIEGVQARREHGRAAAATAVSRAATMAEKAAQKKVSAAGLTNAAEQTKVRPLFYYLKDNKEGIPMSTVGGDSTPMPTASGRATPRPSGAASVPSRSVSTIMAPQVRVVGGEIVVDEESALMKPADASAADMHMDIVHDTGRHLTSHAFVKTIGSNRWNAQETSQFYSALSMCGTDFSLMSMLFPSKSREQIKGKYRVEERNNPKKVETFLRRKKPFDTGLMERVQKEKEENGETAVSLQPENKRGRPKQEFEGSPVPIPSIMSTPHSSAKKRPPLSPPKEADENQALGSPSSSPKGRTSPVKAAAASPLRASPLGKKSQTNTRAPEPRTGTRDPAARTDIRDLEPRKSTRARK